MNLNYGLLRIEQITFFIQLHLNIFCGLCQLVLFLLKTTYIAYQFY